MSKKASKGEKVRKAIIENYKKAEKSFVSQLNFTVPNHPPTIGGFREEIWKQLFEQIVPKKYVIEQSVFLIDSNENVSNEVDLAIFDEMYTPYIFRKGRIKFIPIEAVAAVVQCKSQNVEIDEDIKNIKKWCDSINNLNTSGDSITRLAQLMSVGPAKYQTGTRPIKILCSLQKPSKKLTKSFDIYIIANKKPPRIKIKIPHEDDWNLANWHGQLNMCGNSKTELKYPEVMYSRKLSDYQVIDEKGQLVSLLTLNLQLNQLLMLINNPMFFPHKAYADMFNRKGNGKEDKNDDGNTN